MVPNVYGMSQFADGGLMCTKPYISGSNYLVKWGFPSGEWQKFGMPYSEVHVCPPFVLQPEPAARHVAENIGQDAGR